MRLASKRGQPGDRQSLRRARERERELVKVDEAKSRIMALEVNMQAVEPQKLNVEWRKNASIR